MVNSRSPFLTKSPSWKKTFGQLPADLRLHRDGGVGFHVADDLDFDRHVAFLGGGHRDRDVAAAAALPPPLLRPAAGGIGFGRRAAGAAAERQGEHHATDREPRSA